MRNAFARFEADFDARCVSLLCNWRSHAELVRVQYLVARQIDPDVEEPQARANREVDGDIAAIWEFASAEDETTGLTNWIVDEVQASNIRPHDLAILVRINRHAKEIEKHLAPNLFKHGIRLRNIARNVGDIAIQDLLGEDLTGILLPLLRLGATDRSAADWNTSLRNLQYLEAVDPADDLGQAKIKNRLLKFLRELRDLMRRLEPSNEAVEVVTRTCVEFIGVALLRQAFPDYQSEQDFARVRDGFIVLFQEGCAVVSNRLLCLEKRRSTCLLAYQPSNCAGF